MIWDFKDLRALEGTQKHSKNGKGTVSVPGLFLDWSVGIPKPSRGRIGTDAVWRATSNPNLLVRS